MIENISNRGIQKSAQSRQSKEIQLQKTKDGRAVTYDDEKDYNAKIIYNDVLIDYILEQVDGYYQRGKSFFVKRIFDTA